MRLPCRQLRPLLIASLSTFSINVYSADSTTSPFNIKELNGGYQIAASDNNQVKKPATKKTTQGNCGEGKCAANKKSNEATCGIYNVGSAHKDNSKIKDGKCGGHKMVESLCGGG